MQIINKPFLLQQASYLLLYVRRKKYEWLLFSFMLLIFGSTFSSRQRIVGIVDIYQNFFIGFIVFYPKKQLRRIILFVILTSLALEIFQTRMPYIDARSYHGILYLIFFASVSKEVYKEVLYAKTVTRELLAAALCGFVLLCLIGTFLFYQIELKMPNSFANVGDKTESMNNLSYFSFSTLLTIGYGDITPVSLLAKRAVMLVGLAGHFYTVFITSIIIGKYLSSKQHVLILANGTEKKLIEINDLT